MFGASHSGSSSTKAFHYITRSVNVDAAGGGVGGAEEHT